MGCVHGILHRAKSRGLLLRARAIPNLWALSWPLKTLRSFQGSGMERPESASLEWLLIELLLSGQGDQGAVTFTAKSQGAGAIVTEREGLPGLGVLGDLCSSTVLRPTTLSSQGT